MNTMTIHFLKLSEQIRQHPCMNNYQTVSNIMLGGNSVNEE